jgi:CPA2 family monovalent cation:H+ antiporter-2
LSIAPADIQHFTDTIRQELYAPLYQSHKEYHTVAQLKDAAYLLTLRWLTLPSDGTIVGRSIEELAIRKRTGVSVVGVMRDGELAPNPGPSYRFMGGDMVAAIGTPEQLADFEQMVLDGKREEMI